MMTVQQAIDWAVSQLSGDDISGTFKSGTLKSETFKSETPKLDVEILLGFVLDHNRAWLKTWPEKTISEIQEQAFQGFIRRRQAGEPIAYIVGQQEFWSLTLAVNPATLVPRPETEHLVECALSKIPTSHSPTSHSPTSQAAGDSFVVADLGTGSGAIALAIASERSKATVWALDSCHEALLVAEANRKTYSLDNVECLQGHWLREWDKGELDMIVSNPPYIASDDPHLNDLVFEPHSALVAEREGLSDIEEISEQAIQHLKSGGWLMFEHGFEQADAVQAILRENGFKNIDTLSDLAGLTRITYGQK